MRRENKRLFIDSDTKEALLAQAKIDGWDMGRRDSVCTYAMERISMAHSFFEGMANRSSSEDERDSIRLLPITIALIRQIRISQRMSISDILQVCLSESFDLSSGFWSRKDVADMIPVYGDVPASPLAFTIDRKTRQSIYDAARRDSVDVSDGWLAIDKFVRARALSAYPFISQLPARSSLTAKNKISINYATEKYDSFSAPFSKKGLSFVSALQISLHPKFSIHG